MDTEGAGQLAKEIEKLSLSKGAEQSLGEDGSTNRDKTLAGRQETGLNARASIHRPGSIHSIPPHRRQNRKQHPTTHNIPTHNITTDNPTADNADQAPQPLFEPIAGRLRSSMQSKASNSLSAGASVFSFTSQQPPGYDQANSASFSKPQAKKLEPSKRKKWQEQFAPIAREDSTKFGQADQIAALASTTFPKDNSNSPTPSPARPRSGRATPYFARDAPRLQVMDRPTPTPFYMQCALAEPRRLGRPRPLLVVLDLNGTLLWRKSFGGSNPFIARPGVYQLLEYLFVNHVVMVWSSARPQNVDKMVSDLFTAEQREKIVAVWARDKLGLTARAYNEKVQVYKQLSWIWNVPSIHAKNYFDGLWSQANTVLIDDSAEKAASEPHNIIEVEEFAAKPEQMEENVLGQVAKYLEILREQRDVSAYIRSKPFE